MEHLLPVIDSLKQGCINSDISGVRVYEQSYTEYGNVQLLMVRDGTMKSILIVGSGSLYNDLEGENIQQQSKVCPLTHQNRVVLNRYFDFTVPQAFGPDMATIGLGDRLGLASPGHIEAIKDRAVKPILAQQSIRELKLTGRTIDDVLDAACFAVFQEGYKGGFGADGDHLKKEADIQMALQHGVSLLTLDCSDQIHNDVETADSEEIEIRYNKLPKEVRNDYSERYLNQTFTIKGHPLVFDNQTLMKNVLLYRDAIAYMVHIYKNYVDVAKQKIDFEISIDETATTTIPLAHFFVANELKSEHVEVASLAPRFCGEFQKGIDYIGDVEQFEHELEMHAALADHFGYKLSIHSGSDKFSVFPLIGAYTEGRFHVKTAGTNWLEAVKVVASANPGLYRQMHRYALEHFKDALSYYHVTPDLEGMRPLEYVPDDELTDYMHDNAARQLFHVTYGILLTAKNGEGRDLFSEAFFSTLQEHEEEYRQALANHISKHLNRLGL